MPTAATPWLGRHPVLDENDHADLEARAAVHEFRGGLPREHAETQAHADYLKDRGHDAAAHHLLGIRAATAAGHDEAAAQHGAAYVAAMQAAGEDPFSHPPKQVLDKIKDLRQNVYSFKRHAADGLWEPQVAPEAPPPATERTQQLLTTLQALHGKVKEQADNE